MMESVQNRSNLLRSTSFSFLRKRINSQSQITRDEILNKYNEDIINQVWEGFCYAIYRNYYLGKGTIVPGFGSFTFKNPEVNLEGCTNQYIRDTKPRIPIFLMSYEFLDHIKSSIYFNGNLVQYSQNLNNSLSHVKISYSELGIQLNLNKSDISNIVNNCIRLISDAIIKKGFHNKELPFLGVLMYKNGLLGVKFNEDFINSVKELPQKLNEIKKNIHLFMDSNKIDPRTGKIKKILDSFSEIKFKSVFEGIEAKQEKSNFELGKFINDGKKTKKKLQDFDIKDEILENIFFKRNEILSELKNKDYGYNRKLRLETIIDIFNNLNLHPQFTEEAIKDLISCYFNYVKDEEIDYVTMMETLLQDIKEIIFNKKISLSNHEQSNLPNKLLPVFPKQDCNLFLQENFNPSIYNSNLNATSIDLNSNKTEMEFKKDVKVFKSILNKIKKKTKSIIKIDESSSSNNLLNLLHDNNVIFPIERINQILIFLDLNPQCFNMKELLEKIDEAKVTQEEITMKEINVGIERIRDILFVSEKTPKDLFEIVTNSKFISKEQFIKVIKNLQPSFNEILLNAIFAFFSKNTKFTRIDDFIPHFFKDPPNEAFFKEAIKKINEKISFLNISVEEYFSNLCKIVKCSGKSLNRFEFHQALKNENYNFSSQEIYYLFKMFDGNGDGKLEKEEFIEKVKSHNNPIYKIQEIFRKNGMKIEEIFDKMSLDSNRNEEMDYYTFKTKMRVFERILDFNLVQPIFMKLRNKKRDIVDSKTIYNSFNVFKVEKFDEGNFKDNFIKFVNKFSTRHELQTMFEKRDNYCTGFLDKIDIIRCLNLLKLNTEIKEEDILNFIKNCGIENQSKIKYNDLLDKIFLKGVKDNTKDLKVLKSLMLQEFVLKCEQKLSKFIALVKEPSHIISDDSISCISFPEMKKYLKKLIKEKGLKIEKVSRLLPHLDSDKDGKFNKEDLIILLNKDNLEKRTLLYKEVKNELEEDIKNYDIYPKFEDWIINNSRKINEEALFNLIDFDCDRVISIYDISILLKDKLGIRDEEITRNSVESIIKNINNKCSTEKKVDFYDFKLYYNRVKGIDNEIHIKSKLNGKYNNNLINSLLNTSLKLDATGNEYKHDSLNNLILNLEIYILEKYQSLDEFLQNFKKPMISYDDFKRFLLENNLKILPSMNLSQNDTLLNNLYKYFDSEKKNIISYQNFIDKIKIFDKIKSLHSNVTETIRKNYPDPFESFKSFLGEFRSANRSMKISLSKSWSNNSKISIVSFLTKKDILRKFNSLILNDNTLNDRLISAYLSKHFKDPDHISFSEFSQVYYYKATQEDILNSFNKTFTFPLLKRSKSDFSLPTPIDNDPLIKFKKVIKLNNYEPLEFLKLYEIVSDGKLNEHEFRNIMKRLNIGMSDKDVDKLMEKVEKSRDGLIDLKEFIRKIKNEESFQENQAINIFMAELKSLLNKYYTNPLIAFQNIDVDNKKSIIYDSFKCFITELYNRDSREVPNNKIIKKVFEYMDLNKDSILDQREWSKSLGIHGMIHHKSCNKNEISKYIRALESPRNIGDIYSLINKNKKILKDHCRKFLIRPDFILAENFIRILKETFPKGGISNTQWKMIVSIADKERNGQIDLNLFFEFVGSCSKMNVSVPKLVR